MEETCSRFVQTAKRLRDIWNIGKRLRQDDIEKLKFICVGLIPEERLHELKGSLLLRDIADIGTNECVIEALIRIDRMDLLSQLTGEHEAAKRKFSSLNTTHFDRLRIVLLYIAKNMTDTERLELLKDIVKPQIDDKRRLQRVQKVLDLFDLLIHNVILSPSRPETVTEVFHIYETETWFDKVRSEYESTDKLEVVYTRDQSSLSPGSLDADDITVDVKSQGKSNAPHVDDKNEDTKSLEDSPSIPEFDDKSNTNTEGKPSSKTDDDGNSDEDESMQRERPSTHDSDDKSNINEEKELSSKTDPIDKYEDSLIQGNLSTMSENNNDDTSAPETLSSTPDLTTNNPKTGRTRVIEEHDGISFLNTLSPGEHGEHSQASSEERKQAAQGEYPMKRNPRGCAVIFNIETFNKVPDDPTSTQLENRHGSSKDAEGLNEAFEKLHFIVDRNDDKTIDEIMMKTDEYASRDHSSFDCFVLCILTHGSEGKLYDANGRSFKFERIFKKFHADKCATLDGKPKLFFLQACQGNQCQIGNNPQADTVPCPPRSVNDVREVKTNFLEGNSPNEADFLVFFPARLGLPAFRNDNQGSWFIQSLVENLNKYGESRPLFEIFTKVIHEVSSRLVEDRYGNRYDQTPKFDTSLKMTVFFRPLDE